MTALRESICLFSNSMYSIVFFKISELACVDVCVLPVCVCVFKLLLLLLWFDSAFFSGKEEFVACTRFRMDILAHVISR